MKLTKIETKLADNYTQVGLDILRFILDNAPQGVKAQSLEDCQKYLESKSECSYISLRFEKGSIVYLNLERAGDTFEDSEGTYWQQYSLLPTVSLSSILDNPDSVLDKLNEGRVACEFANKVYEQFHDTWLYVLLSTKEDREQQERNREANKNKQACENWLFSSDHCRHLRVGKSKDIYNLSVTFPPGEYVVESKDRKVFTFGLLPNGNGILTRTK